MDMQLNNENMEEMNITKMEQVPSSDTNMEEAQISDSNMEGVRISDQVPSTDTVKEVQICDTNMEEVQISVIMGGKALSSDIVKEVPNND